ncbi:MAG: SDR family NAD(P)-dependent oxidoreductase [Clostridia bacterium]|nr:SDR family NAD(P)-dependent oxidoreductase [Clostridia bacterium]
MSKTAVVTGGSSGIGLCTCMALKKAGVTIYELSRRHAANEGINHISVDVSDGNAVKCAIDAIAEKEGKIDIVIANAGFGISGAAEFTSNEDAKRLLDVNLFGLVNVCKAVIPHMRDSGGGRIIAISSVAAPVPIPFQAWYSVSKAAINTYTQALGNELRPFNISVTAIMPGDIRTGFTEAREKLHLGDDVYNGRITRSVAVMERDELNGMDPGLAGKYIADIAMRKKVKPLYAIGLKYKFFSVLIRLLPCRLSGRILYEMYAK